MEYIQESFWCHKSILAFHFNFFKFSVKLTWQFCFQPGLQLFFIDWMRIFYCQNRRTISFSIVGEESLLFFDFLQLT